MPEHDESRHPAVGAGASPDDAGEGVDDVVQAVADLVDDLVEDADPPPAPSSP